MKRTLIAIFGVVIIGGAAVFWWVTRDTPEKLLRDSVIALMSAKRFEQVRADVSWTDPEKRITLGWSAVGQLDVADPRQPGFFGVIDLNDGLFGGEQSVDAVLAGTTVALRPHTDGSAADLYNRIVGDRERKTFGAIDRDALLKHVSLGALISLGKSADIRTMLSSAQAVVHPAGDWIVGTGASDRYAVIPFSVDAKAAQPFLQALLRAWTGKDLDPDGYRTAATWTQEAVRGTFRMTADRVARTVTFIDADIPQLDENGAVIRQFHLHLEFYGANGKTDIGLPSSRADVTEAALGVQTTGLPSALQKVGFVVPTGTILAPTRGASDEARFNQYLDELARRRSR